jgi:hypothetical protein
MRIRYKNQIILVPNTVNQNEFLLAEKYISMKGVFSVENRILDNVKCVLSLSVADSTNTKYVCVRIYLEVVKEGKNGWLEKKRKKIFFSSVVPRDRYPV